MKRAIELARNAWGKTHPNPMVAAVTVKDGKIIGEGFHKKDGDLHAERNALNSLKESAAGAEMYVSLEPCSTKGRTGACTDAIIASGIKKVFIGALDPNPAHAGRAVEILKNAGIECVCGILPKECADLNIIFNSSIVSKTAMLAIKFAQTKNGKIAEHKGKPSPITSASARAHLMRYRELFPAIAAGFGTLISDNPSLTIRDEIGERSNFRFLLDRSLNCAELNLSSFRLFSDKFSEKTTVVCDAEA
ncbi:MAG: bifunctional diaminohydroxyphosphoribosylaminopyrimidine deaminase/5-amino-6-(5-phosphoribosylamino)uracil reductase RibD, partial [Opitutales bacterium]|nr:bifunctional diaminohydroxyphosphoribosylaminopyrimidine deaminase/5-amino-6-(5-phosphoribosylamino)uracil reductase RibD [Opitutales bacterium]